MVLNSYAVVHPGTVVIVSFDALIANIAVFRSRSFDNFAFWTELMRFSSLHELKKVDFFRFDHNSCVCVHSYKPEYDCDHASYCNQVYAPHVIPARE